MTDIIEKLEDLHKQATTERSHFYVAGCCKEAIAEITELRAMLTEADIYLGGVRAYNKIGALRERIRHIGGGEK